MLINGLITRCLAASAIAWRTNPLQLSASSSTDAKVAQLLDSVWVFGLLLTEEAKLYGDAGTGASMIYTSLSDANRVLAQLKSAFPTTDLELIPLPLGKVLMQAGILDPPSSFEAADDGVQMQLVASPEEKRAARQLREESATPKPRPREGAAGLLQEIPVFHIGSVEHPSEGTDAFWPFFFRTADVDALWEQLGEGAPRPEITPTDLAALVDGLRDIESAPAKPLVCAPLDGLKFVQERDRAAAASAEEARSAAPPDE